MPTVADYAVLSDGSFVLENGEEHELQPFFAPDGFVAGTNLAKAILAYKAQALSSPPFAPQAELEITGSVFQTPVHNVTIAGDTLRGLWEAFPATGFGQNIGTIFRFRSISGRVRISDVVLWYQISV